MEVDMIDINQLHAEMGTVETEVGDLQYMIGMRDIADDKPEHYEPMAKLIAEFRIRFLMERAALNLRLDKHDANAAFDAAQERVDDARYGTYAEQHSTHN
jgi:hypothetical protein